jgi:hypothetical protein
VLVAARGAQANEVLAALSALAERDFDERHEPAAAPQPARPSPSALSDEGSLQGLSCAPGAARPARPFARRSRVPTAASDRPQGGRRSSAPSSACGRRSRPHVSLSPPGRASTTRRSSTLMYHLDDEALLSLRGGPSSRTGSTRRRRGTRLAKRKPSPGTQRRLSSLRKMHRFRVSRRTSHLVA